MIENPNEYNDELYARYSTEVGTTIESLWAAGAGVEDIENGIENGFANAGVEVVVSIMEKAS